jgi:hypothetical protein
LQVSSRQDSSQDFAAENFSSYLLRKTTNNTTDDSNCVNLISTISGRQSTLSIKGQQHFSSAFEWSLQQMTESARNSEAGLYCSAFHGSNTCSSFRSSLKVFYDPKSRLQSFGGFEAYQLDQIATGGNILASDGVDAAVEQEEAEELETLEVAEDEMEDEDVDDLLEDGDDLEDDDDEDNDDEEDAVDVDDVVGDGDEPMALFLNSAAGQAILSFFIVSSPLLSTWNTDRKLAELNAVKFVFQKIFSISMPYVFQINRVNAPGVKKNWLIKVNTNAMAW